MKVSDKRSDTWYILNLIKLMSLKIGLSIKDRQRWRTSVSKSWFWHSKHNYDGYGNESIFVNRANVFQIGLFYE